MNFLKYFIKKINIKLFLKLIFFLSNGEKPCEVTLFNITYCIYIYIYIYIYDLEDFLSSGS